MHKHIRTFISVRETRVELYHQVRKTIRCYAQHSIHINPSHQISNKPQIPPSIAQGITFEMYACFRTPTLQLPNPIPSIVYQIESQIDRLLFLSSRNTFYSTKIHIKFHVTLNLFFR